MARDGHMRFFDVERCGFYTYNQSFKLKDFDLERSFDEIIKWYDGRSLAQTMPWSIESRANKAKCYLRDVYKNENTSDFIVVLWKSETGTNESLIGLEPDEKGGSGQEYDISKKKGGKQLIIGLPCYYWVIPEKNCIVSIKLENSLTDAELFSDYLKACLGHRIDLDFRKVENDTDSDSKITYITQDDKGRDRSFFYRFEMHQIATKASDLSFAEISRNTVKIVNRISVSVDSEDDRKTWLKLFDDKGLQFIPNKGSNRKHTDRRIEVSYEAKPSVAEVEAIIKQHGDVVRDESQWDNIGFRYEDNTTVWLDYHLVKDTVRVEGGSVLKASELWSYVEKNRSRYLKLIATKASQDIQAIEAKKEVS